MIFDFSSIISVLLALNSHFNFTSSLDKSLNTQLSIFQYFGDSSVTDI
jgi:hypothetical protein